MTNNYKNTKRATKIGFAATLAMSAIFAIVVPASASRVHDSLRKFDNGCQVNAIHGDGGERENPARAVSYAITKDNNGKCGLLEAQIGYRKDGVWREVRSGYQDSNKVSVRSLSDLDYSDHNIRVKAGSHQGFRMQT